MSHGICAFPRGPYAVPRCGFGVEAIDRSSKALVAGATAAAVAAGADSGPERARVMVAFYEAFAGYGGGRRRNFDGYYDVDGGGRGDCSTYPDWSVGGVDIARDGIAAGDSCGGNVCDGASGVDASGGNERAVFEGVVGGNECGDSVGISVENSCGEFVPSTRAVKSKKKRSKKKRGMTHVGEVATESVVGKESSVPLWRRGAGSPTGRVSRFASCSDAVQSELAETQAKALIAKNKADVLRSEEHARVIAARIKAGVPERRIEKQRIELNAKLIPLVQQQRAQEAGYVEAGSVSGVLSDMPSLSPDDSISVSDRIALGTTICELREEVASMRVENSKLKEEIRMAGSLGYVSKLAAGMVPFREELEARDENQKSAAAVRLNSEYDVEYVGKQCYEDDDFASCGYGY